MNFRNILIALLAIFIYTHAFAEDSKPVAPVQKMRRVSGDENRDGLLSKDEYLKLQAKRFDEMDANHDGNITADEKTAYDEVRRLAKEKKAANHADKKAPGDDKKTFINRFFD